MHIPLEGIHSGSYGKSLTTWLAMWGAFTGTVAWAIGVYNFWLDRPRIRLKMSMFSEDEVQRIDDSLLFGEGGRYVLVEVVNSGRRKAGLYQPEMWVRNELGTLDHEAPLNCLRDETWGRITNPWKLYSLSEGDTVTFLFKLGLPDSFARLDVADSLARFYHLRTIFGSMNWWRGKFKGTKQWRGMREAFFGRQRPRHHRND